VPGNYTYDGAAVLVEDGIVIAAMEEERLNRVKRSNKFPVEAIRYCLSSGGLQISDLDRIAYYVDENAANNALDRMFATAAPGTSHPDARALFSAVLLREFGSQPDPAKLAFYEHKLTHAACAMHQSGFDSCLVCVLDNAGGVYHGTRGKDGLVSLDPITATEPADSLQKLCHAVLPNLGLGFFDEYKAYGMAPYGQSGKYQAELGQLYELHAGGRYELKLAQAAPLLQSLHEREAGLNDAFRQDLAASLQEALERIVLHMLAHHRAESGANKLCLAGGMAENVGLATAILEAGLFDDVFVHPVAYDAGCALGAALLASQDLGAVSQPDRVTHLRWGSAPEDLGPLDQQISAWSQFVAFEPVSDVARLAAELVSGGSTLGWIAGRSEFGTHALGSRNAFADIGNPSNSAHLHQCLGRDETYRPLAAVVREDDLEFWTGSTGGTPNFPFQTFALPIRPDLRARIPAALDRDGRARLQTVARASSQVLWEILTHLQEISGTAAMLSSSLNRSSEPTVETVEDAIACFLNSKLDYLIIGHFVASRVPVEQEQRATMLLALPPHLQLLKIEDYGQGCKSKPVFALRSTAGEVADQSITRQLGQLLTDLDPAATLAQQFERDSLYGSVQRSVMAEIEVLWSRGLIKLRPNRNLVLA